MNHEESAQGFYIENDGTLETIKKNIKNINEQINRDEFIFKEKFETIMINIREKINNKKFLQDYNEQLEFKIKSQKKISDIRLLKEEIQINTLKIGILNSEILELKAKSSNSIEQHKKYINELNGELEIQEAQLLLYEIEDSEDTSLDRQTLENKVHELISVQDEKENIKNTKTDVELAEEAVKKSQKFYDNLYSSSTDSYSTQSDIYMAKIDLAKKILQHKTIIYDNMLKQMNDIQNQNYDENAYKQAQKEKKKAESKLKEVIEDFLMYNNISSRKNVNSSSSNNLNTVTTKIKRKKLNKKIINNIDVKSSSEIYVKKGSEEDNEEEDNEEEDNEEEDTDEDNDEDNGEDNDGSKYEERLEPGKVLEDIRSLDARFKIIQELINVEDSSTQELINVEDSSTQELNIIFTLIQFVTSSNEIIYKFSQLDRHFKNEIERVTDNLSKAKDILSYRIANFKITNNNKWTIVSECCNLLLTNPNIIKFKKYIIWDLANIFPLQNFQTNRDDYLNKNIKDLIRIIKDKSILHIFIKNTKYITSNDINDLCIIEKIVLKQSYVVINTIPKQELDDTFALYSYIKLKHVYRKETFIVSNDNYDKIEHAEQSHFNKYYNEIELIRTNFESDTTNTINIASFPKIIDKYHEDRRIYDGTNILKRPPGLYNNSNNDLTRYSSMRDTNEFLHKYLKYKQKYLKLKNSLP
jgi:hypothetical protein